MSPIPNIRVSPVRSGSVGNWQVSPSGDFIKADDYPYLVEWVSQMNNWASAYEIYEFIQANEVGEDPTARLPAFNGLSLGIDTNFIWTVSSSSGEEVVSSGYEWGVGSSVVKGWYLGKVSHEGKTIVLDHLKVVCALCQGKLYFLDANNDEQECEKCLQEEVYIWLSDTDFKLNSL